MESAEIFSIGFYLWWLGINSCLYFAEFHFIQNFTGIRVKRFLIRYVLFSDLLTFFVMFHQSPGVLRLLLHAGIIVGFSVFCLKRKWLVLESVTIHGYSKHHAKNHLALQKQQLLFFYCIICLVML